MTRPNPTAFAGQHTWQPLPFDPQALTGLSQCLFVSPHENHCGSAVRSLNGVGKPLARAVHRAWAC